MRIIEAAMERAGLPMDKVFVNIEKYGNTSAASIPMAFDEAKRLGKIKKGDYVVMVAFGAGLTWGSAVVRW
jgi:3-oxoacyl-[acyl-carrier-protein] synthase-3